MTIFEIIKDHHRNMGRASILLVLLLFTSETISARPDSNRVQYECSDDYLYRQQDNYLPFDQETTGVHVAPELLADSQIIQFVGNWPFAFCWGGIEPDTARGLVYLASGGGVYVLDVSDPSKPIKISEGIHTLDRIYDMHYDETNHLLYIPSWGSRLEIWDVSDYSQPTRISTCDTISNAAHVFVVDNYAYVAEFGEGLWVVDITDPANPDPLSFITIPSFWPSGLVVENSYAYLSSGQYGIHIVDITDPLDPQLISSYDPGNASDIDVSYPYLYAAAGNNGISVVDISDPAAPHLVTQYPYSAGGIDISGSNLYITDGLNGVRVLDITDPMDPQLIGECYAPSHAVFVSGEIGYALGGYGLVLLSLTEDLSPTLIGEYDTPSKHRDVRVSGQHAYVISWHRGLYVINIKDITNPFAEGYCRIRSAIRRIDVSGTLACIADWLGGVWLVDITDPTYPYIIAHFASPARAYDIFICDSILYIAGGYDGLIIVDISNPAFPIETGHYSNCYAFDVFVSEQYAYVADGDGLTILDISSNVAVPQLVGEYDIPNVGLPEHPYSIHISGICAYLGTRGDYDAGLRIIDISAPSSPVEIGNILHYDGIYDLDFVDAFVYAVCEDFEPLIYDVSIPANPSFMCFFGRLAYGIDAINEFVFLATRYTGLRIYRNILLNAGDYQTNAPSTENAALQPTIIRNGFAELILNLEVNIQAQAEVYNIVGQQVKFLQDIHLGGGKNRFRIPLSDLQTGVYFIKFVFDKTFVTKKIIVVK